MTKIQKITPEQIGVEVKKLLKLAKTKKEKTSLQKMKRWIDNQKKEVAKQKRIEEIIQELYKEVE